MVVEDQSDYLEAMVSVLYQTGFVRGIYIAKSGEAALEAFPKIAPDLVLVDFRLPGINGLEVAKQIKQMRPDIKVAIVTAYSDEVLARLAQQAEAHEFIPKDSFSLEAIKHLLYGHS